MSDTKLTKLTGNTDTSALRSVCPYCLASVRLDDVCEACGARLGDPNLGATIAGRYKIEQVIGRGGMGSVYRAQHLELGEPVAIKFLQEGWSHSPALRARFRREAVALSRLRHPSIVSLLDFGEYNDELYMVMELVHGVPLSEPMYAGPLAPPRIGAIFHEILQVLEAAHAVGVIHRDMKPGNVMLLNPGEPSERVKVLDFGLAYVDDTNSDKRLTETGTAQGTPLYMSPEQCRGHGVGTATDIYAVGVMLFEAFTGRPPFRAEESAALMAQHLFVEAPRMSEVGGRLAFAEGLENIVRRALAKDPAQRPTAPMLRDMLAAAIAGTDASAVLDRATDERVVAMGMTRAERSLGEVARVKTDSVPPPGEVVLWMPESPDALEIGMTLEVNQLSASVWPGTDPPTSPAALIVVLAEPDGSARTRSIRAQPGRARLPILVIGAATTARVSDLIRAGASDVVLAADGSGDVLRRVKRLLRRGR